MKNGILLALVFMFMFAYGSAQKKVVSKHSTKQATTIRTTSVPSRAYGSATSIAQVTDVPQTSPAYESVKSLIENYSVPIVFSDNAFHGKEALHRGDFIVGLNGAYNAVKRVSVDAGLDTSLINTYDRNRSYITSVNEIKDLSQTSVYYEATQSLVEKWGVAAPFTKAKMLNPHAMVNEGEAYDILNVTLGYHSETGNKSTTSISREKFAIILNTAILQKISVIMSLQAIRQAESEAYRKRQQDSINYAEMIRKQAIAKEIEAKKLEAQKKEAEAREKLKEKDKK